MKTLLLCALLCASPAPSPAPSPSTALDSMEDIERMLAAASATPSPSPARSPGPARSPAPPKIVEHSYPDEHEHVEPHRHEPHHWYQAFEYDFMQRAVLTGLLAGTLCTWLGVLVVLRRMVFVGVALAQIASAGVAVGVLTGLEPVLVATIATVVFSIYSGLARLKGALSPETRVGLAYVLGGASAVLLLSRSGTGEAEQLEMLHGSLLAVPNIRVAELAVLAMFVVVAHFALFRKLVAVAFDPISARVGGLSVARLNLMFFLLLGTGVSASIQSCGLLLVFGYLLIPPATGLVTGFRLRGVMIVAMTTQAVSTLLGLWIAYEWDLPPGPTIAMSMLSILAAATVISRITHGRST